MGEVAGRAILQCLKSGSFEIREYLLSVSFRRCQVSGRDPRLALASVYQAVTAFHAAWASERKVRSEERLIRWRWVRRCCRSLHEW